MKKIFILTLIATVLVSFSINRNLDSPRNQRKYAFKSGVSLNHWTSYPLDSFTYADPKWFNRKDVEWIAQTGIDHIQLYVSGTEILTKDGKIMADRIIAIDSFVTWCTDLSLGVIISPARMPSLPMDSSLTREERAEKNMQNIASYFEVLADYFKTYGENVRFLLNIGIDDKTLRNRYYQLVVPVIRKTNPDRKLYVTAYSIDKLSELEIPKDDKNIFVAAEISQSSAPKAEAIDVFGWQHQDYFFTDKMPLITFPGTIPTLDTTMVTNLGRWAIPFSNTRIEMDYFEKKFSKANLWMKEHHPGAEFYVSHFRYWTGYPFDPKTTEDGKSLKNFIGAFNKAAKKHNISWCMYDYNSGSGIRYPNGKKALILELLGLDRP